MDLWHEIDNNHQQSPDSTAQGRLHRVRRITERMVLAALREWLQDDYVATYGRALGATRIFSRCYWIDALGSEGKASVVPSVPSENGSAEESTTTRAKKRRKQEAIPLPPALQPIGALAQTLAQEKPSIALYGLILAAGSSRRKENRAMENGGLETKEISLPKESGIIAASWLEAAPTVLKEIEQSPAIFLLNPFGHTMFTNDDLARLYQRTVPTELCLFVPHKQIETRLLAAQANTMQARALTGLLRTDRWKTLPIQAETMERAIAGFLDLFTTAMQRHFVLPVQQIELRLQSGPATVEDVPYTLVFATRRQDSLASMNDAVCRYRRRIATESRLGVLGEEWFATQERERHEEELQYLYEQIRQRGHSQRIRRWPDLRQQILLTHFGQFTIHDYDMLIQQLLINREVRCEWRQKPQSANGQNAEHEVARTPGNDDLLIWR
jgi:hypothetical protein